MTAPRIIRITDEVTGCDCCGRTGLKRTVELDFDGERVYYGTTCAARAFPALGNGATILRSAAARCVCGCGQFGTVGTVGAGIWARPCYDAKRREVAA